MATLDDLIDEQNTIRAELAALDDNPDTTEEDHGDLRDTLIARWKAIETRKAPLIARMEDLQLIKRAASDPANLESGDGGGTPWRGGRHGPEFMTRHDPFAGREETQDYQFLSRADVVARAHTAVEDADKQGWLRKGEAEEATRKSNQPGIARHMLLYGSPEYAEAFRDYLNRPDEVQRALVLATASGGVMLPYMLDPTIVLTNDGSANPFRRLANVQSITTNAYHGVSSAGVTAAWLNETTAASDNSPTFGSIAVYPKKAAAWVYGSFEVIEDTSFGDQLPRLLSDAKDRLEEAAFAAGTGANTDNTGAPAGIAPALATGTRNIATNTTGGAFVQGTAGQADIYGVQAKLAPRWRSSPSCAWVMNITNINKVRAIDQYGGGAFWANLGQGQPGGLLGQRVEESTSITVSTGTGATTAYAAAVYGDWSQYYIVDRIGTQMLYEPLVKATSSIGAPTGQSGWLMFWRVGGGVANASSFSWQLNGTA